jgi:hypothetical protein
MERPYPVHRIAAVLFCVLALLVFISPQAQAQDYRAKLTVTVTDSTGAVVPNATLQLESGSTKIVTPAKTNEVGSFIFQFLEPDTYVLKVSATSMSPAELTGIRLQSYAASSVKVELKPAVANEQVIVTAQARIVGNTERQPSF